MDASNKQKRLKNTVVSNEMKSILTILIIVYKMTIWQP
jgi:hypothetical protein